MRVVGTATEARGRGQRGASAQQESRRAPYCFRSFSTVRAQRLRGSSRCTSSPFVVAGGVVFFLFHSFFVRTFPLIRACPPVSNAGRPTRRKDREKEDRFSSLAAAAAAAVAVLFFAGSRRACVFLVGAYTVVEDRRSTEDFTRSERQRGRTVLAPV